MDWGDWPTKTDKGYAHNMLVVYERLIVGVDLKKILEIGILGGQSIRMWHDLFPEAEVVAVDIDDCSSLANELDRVTVIHGDAYSSAVMSSMGAGFDLIVEDGSHILKHQCYAAEHLPRLLSKGGVMLIEDVASIEDAHVIQHFIPDSYIDNSYIIDRRGAPCPYPYQRFDQRNEILVVVDNRAA